MNVGQQGPRPMMTGASAKPPVGGLNLITVTRGPGGGMNVEVNRAGGGGTTIHSGHNRAAVLQASRMPSGGGGGMYMGHSSYSSNAVGAVQPQMASTISVPIGHGGDPASSSVIQAPKPGPQLVPKPGSNYSGSPRSSIGSYDSKNSSPRASMVNPPPPPYMDQRHGSPGSGSSVSVRSSVSVDSKHTSPRASITSISSTSLYETKFPSSRGSMVSQNERYVATRNVAVEHHVSGAYDKMQMSPGAHAATGSPKHAVASLFERFNEPAPPPHYESQPPPYDARMRALHLSQVNVPPQQQQQQQQQQHSQVQQSPKHSQYRITRVPQSSSVTSTEAADPNKPSTTTGVPSVSIGIPPQTVTHFPIVSQNQTHQNEQPNTSVNNNANPNPQSQLLTRLRGLNYDVVPRRQDGPSDAERKLAALTQQLENEMNISGSSKKSPDDAPVQAPSKSPPPYHGPHITGAQMNNYTNSPVFTNRTITVGTTSSPASSTLSSPGSSKAPSLSGGQGVMASLPVQVTPPQPKGPTEAERKLEALTQELENQMENNPQGDYYGKDGVWS